MPYTNYSLYGVSLIIYNLTTIYALFNRLNSFELFVAYLEFNNSINGSGNINTSGNISGIFYSINGSKGISDNVSVCKRIQGMACTEWKTLNIENGLVVGNVQ